MCGELELYVPKQCVPDKARVSRKATQNFLPDKALYLPRQLDCDAINNGQTDIPAINIAHNIVVLSKGGEAPELFGGEMQKTQQIIEMARSLEKEPNFFPGWLLETVLPQYGQQVVSLINKELEYYQSGAYNMQLLQELAPQVI